MKNYTSVSCHTLPPTLYDVKGRNIFRRVLFSPHEEQTHFLHGDLRSTCSKVPSSSGPCVAQTRRTGRGFVGNIGTLVRFGVMTDIPPHLIELARRLEEALRAAALRREKQLADAAHRRPSAPQPLADPRPPARSDA